MAERKFRLGRQKIPMEKISKKSNLKVTFSKRRGGLFKKASELCTLCGVEIAIIVFSPSDKAFSFGHPEVESLIDSYLTRNTPLDPSTTSNQLVNVGRNANVFNLNMQLTQILNQMEIEKKLGEELDRARKARQTQFWWETPIDELGQHELQHLMFSMEKLKKIVTTHANRVFMEQASFPLPITGPGPNGFGLYAVSENNPARINANPSILSFPY
ncbi:agamous-like MADS-box protein AGL62 [Gastrolobium bilobum]|uniref:agamous-like MADS-box protein AGL62 n=1 Tax=Gastrolobium bilobum TaxID=150636 RepID=UPI002AB31FA1|nr:agamous-like MADS-box protein AGL62 [Gastrolobium bilobum]